MHIREPKNPRVVLLEDHEHIDHLLDRLVATMRSTDRDAGAKLWKKIEETLLRHLDVEETFVFPALRDGHSVEVEHLRKQHDEIRKQIGEIGLAIELHTLRCETIECFCSSLREHAEREDSLAYVQAGRSLSIGVGRAIAARVKAVVAPLRRTARLRTHAVRSAT